MQVDAKHTLFVWVPEYHRHVWVLSKLLLIGSNMLQHNNTMCTKEALGLPRLVLKSLSVVHRSLTFTEHIWDELEQRLHPDLLTQHQCLSSFMTGWMNTNSYSNDTAFPEEWNITGGLNLAWNVNKLHMDVMVICPQVYLQKPFYQN